MKTQEVNRLTRELWDTRRVLSAAQARESTLKKNLQRLNYSKSGGYDADKESKPVAPCGAFLSH
jgi:hypothetical protein